MAAATPFTLSDKQQEAVLAFFKVCKETQNGTPLREHFEYIDREYYRENLNSEAFQEGMRQLKKGNKKIILDQTIPVVMPHVEAIVTHLTGVFLSGYPIFGVTAPPALADAGLQMEAIVKENSIRKAWARHLRMFFLDGAKYDLAFLEVDWKQENYFSIASAAATEAGRGVPKSLLWEGNVLTRLDPYNTYWDRRVAPAEVHECGEFAGYTKLLSRVQLKTLLTNLPATFTMNAKKAFESSPGSSGVYYDPKVNLSSLLTTISESRDAGSGDNINWLKWAGLSDASRRINYRDEYDVDFIVARIIPSDFGLNVPAKNHPQVWKFIVVNSSVIIYAERQTNAHNWLPIVVSQPIEDGLGLQTKGIAENVISVQDTASALWNANLAARRRMVYDRMFYDPSRVKLSDINSTNPIARIPVKPAAYSKAVGEAVYIAPYRSEGADSLLPEAEQIIGFGERINGINRVQQGQFQRGNKTRKEWDDTMDRSNGRLHAYALNIENQTMIRIKHMIKLNILQFQPPGEITPPGSKKAVTISPAELRKADLDFNLSDGFLPSDTLIPSDVLTAFMQMVGASPQMQAEYDLIGAFAYWCKEQGATWLNDFRRNPQQQEQFLQQLQATSNAQQPPQPAPPTEPTV